MKIIRGRFDPIPRSYSRALNDLVNACLQRDYKKRPTIKSILLMEHVQKRAHLLKIKLPIKREEKVDTSILNATAGLGLGSSIISNSSAT